MEEKKQPERVVMNVDDLIKIVIDETTLDISQEESAKLQLKHDEEMAKRFGFPSYDKLKQYLEICNSNNYWAEIFGYAGFLSNKAHISEFLTDSDAFATKVIDYQG